MTVIIIVIVQLNLTFRFHIDDMDEDVFEDILIEKTEKGKYCLTGQVSLLVLLFWLFKRERDSQLVSA